MKFLIKRDFKGVYNLDGNLNVDKTNKALNDGRKLKIKLSEVYETLKAVESLKNLNIFDSEVIEHDIGVSNKMFSESIGKFNTHVDDLINSAKAQDIKLVRDSLIHIRVQSMSIASDFDNLKDDIDELIKAL